MLNYNILSYAAHRLCTCSCIARSCPVAALQHACPMHKVHVFLRTYLVIGDWGAPHQSNMKWYHSPSRAAPQQTHQNNTRKVLLHFNLNSMAHAIGSEPVMQDSANSWQDMLANTFGTTEYLRDGSVQYSPRTHWRVWLAQLPIHSIIPNLSTENIQPAAEHASLMMVHQRKQVILSMILRMNFCRCATIWIALPWIQSV